MSVSFHEDLVPDAWSLSDEGFLKSLLEFDEQGIWKFRFMIVSHTVTVETHFDETSGIHRKGSL